MNPFFCYGSTIHNVYLSQKCRLPSELYCDSDVDTYNSIAFSELFGVRFILTRILTLTNVLYKRDDVLNVTFLPIQIHCRAAKYYLSLRSIYAHKHS